MAGCPASHGPAMVTMPASATSAAAPTRQARFASRSPRRAPLQVTGTYQAAVDGTGGVYLASTDTTFDVGTGPLLGGPGVAIARIAP